MARDAALLPATNLQVLCKGQMQLGALIATLDSSELDEIADEYLMWNERYE